jgi:hypothetical protein
MSLCLVTIFKNEAHIMKEWMTHYISQGVDKFLMIDNDSTDNYFEILSPYINNSIVDLRIDKRKHSQTICYNEIFLQECKKYDWAIVCDLDEFIYARKGFKNIKDYLNTLSPNISQVSIPWKIFGSNGFNTIDKKQPDSIVKSFTKRIFYDKNDNFQGVITINNNKLSLSKTIIKTSKLIRFAIHSHKTVDTNAITSDNVEHSHGEFSKISEDILEKSCLHLNHYAIQSFKWFMEVKSTRGAADNIENCRNEKYFKDFDNSANDIVDLELFTITMNT